MAVCDTVILRNAHVVSNMENPSHLKCVVQTEHGAVRGYIDSENERICYKFKRIPYAKPPIGNLRFLPPSPISKWAEELDCTQDAPMPISLNNTELSSEDCLYIEVSSPNINPDKLMPVMFWIGSVNYAYCFDELYESTALIDNGVIFVRCGFRIGPFGFLSINHISAPGNCGLKDIVMALKWVQKNIAYFGGDPNNVTLFGSNSGGSIVHLMTLSPMATGLFQKAIVQSACALNSWSFTLNPLNAVLELASQLGIKKTDEHEIIGKLKLLPAKTIMKGFYALFLKTHDTDYPDSIFKPCIEDEFEGQQAFLTRNPNSLIKSGVYNRVPMIIGSNNIEEAVMAHIRNDFYNTVRKSNFNLTTFKPLSEQTKSFRTVSKQKLLPFYLGENTPLTEANRHQYAQMISDFYFLYYINKSVRLHSESSPETPIFYYMFNCAVHLIEIAGIKNTNFLTGYSAELRFILSSKLPNIETTHTTRDSIMTRNRMIKMWTNFAKYGNPTPDDDDPLLQVTWKPVESIDRLHYLSIGHELTVGRNPFQDRMKFWDEIHDTSDVLKCILYCNEKGIRF